MPKFTLVLDEACTEPRPSPCYLEVYRAPQGDDNVWTLCGRVATTVGALPEGPLIRQRAPARTQPPKPSVAQMTAFVKWAGEAERETMKEVKRPQEKDPLSLVNAQPYAEGDFLFEVIGPLQNKGGQRE